MKKIIGLLVFGLVSALCVPTIASLREHATEQIDNVKSSLLPAGDVVSASLELTQVLPATIPASEVAEKSFSLHYLGLPADRNRSFASIQIETRCRSSKLTNQLSYYSMYGLANL